MPSVRLIPLVCLSMAASAFSIGAFPALLPEIGAAARLGDAELGAVAAAFGFARMLTDVPAGLFITHHLRRALVLAPVFLLTGVVCLGAGGPLPLLLLGRGLMGAGHTLALLGGLTAILRYRAGPVLASSLNAFELSAMLGMLGGVTVLNVVPRTLSWNATFTVACTPLLLTVALLPAVLGRLPRGDEAPAGRPLFARSEVAPAAPPRAAGSSAASMLLPLAFAAGATIALTYSTMEQFVVPVRGSREFGLDRVGIARVLILVQACDIGALLPLGALADRRGAPRVLLAVLLSFAAAMALTAFGDLSSLRAGAVLFGLSLSGWMLPVSILRSVTPPAQVAWRTSLYRVGVDAGLFLGPFLSGLLGAGHGRVLPGVLIAALLSLAALLALAPRRVTGRPASRR